LASCRWFRLAPDFDRRGYALCDENWVLMLPDANNFPTARRQFGVVSAVATGVAFELRDPVCAVSVRQVPVLWAPVPEAAIDEHSNASAVKDDVRATGKLSDRPHVLPEPETSLVKK
jgi:hypothetical protein